MTLSSIKKNPLITGTLLMTAAGVLSRIIGFFYRIFLSRTIGAEALGIYQLIGPVFSLCFALTASSIQTSISKFVSDAIGGCKDSLCGEKKARAFLLLGLVLSCGLSALTGIFMYCNADWIATRFLGEARCAPLLVLLTYSLLPCCIHACINGYYYGKKNAFVPSLCQLIEQIARVGSVWIIFQVTTEKGIPLTAFHAVCGLVIGECFGLLVSMSALLQEKRLPRGSYSTDSVCNRTMTHAFLAMVIPLTINRLSVAFSTSLENLLIPQKLQLYGYSQADALSVYGILSGMTLSIILFPCVLTNSLSVLLLPAISEAKGRANENQIRRTTKKAIRLGLLLGFAFTILFLFTGDMIGNKLFHNALAGRFICRLAWLCPLMYISSLLSSILHGLGRPKQVLFVNLLACLIRIGMIWFLVPGYGIGAYLWGLLLSQVFASVACMWLLREYM
ncbi:polysaccharide biosynthesis protein [Roseburia hominis]|uniref:polysaccharide biosynthesis protein n=1 Tax=Roseburia hominis TaxID=301301 RepID=UPI0026F0CECF|nr:polysaccharide biosynthesis protein [Roseburia hominis]MCI7522205.1 polysaccharide biosynthesis protein [Roseburia hominis]